MNKMDRCNCTMSEVWSGIIYCGYYDILCMKCEEVTDCPEELDEDDDEEYIDECDITDSDIEYY
jgi:hypothetical protein